MMKERKVERMSMKGDCDGCKKPAIVHMTDIIGGEKGVRPYCGGWPQDARGSIPAPPPPPDQRTA